MDYVIKNHKGVYIRLNQNGKAVTCAESEKTLFEQSKAKNILDNLPKTLKRLQFKVEAIPDIQSQINKEFVSEIKKEVIESSDYELSENILRWIDKFGSCYDVLKDAEQTLKNSIKELERSDQELLDILHSIELEPQKDLYNGWKLYKAIRENRKNRRVTKDETLIIHNVLEKINPSCLKREHVQKAIDGLIGRKYKFRIVEEEESDVV